MICSDCEERPATRADLCHRCYQRKWMREHYSTPKAKETRRKWLSQNKPKVIWLAAKHRAKRDGVPFSIKVSDIVIPDVCPVLGIKISHTGRNRDSSPSLDKLIPELGYVPGNIMVISNRANRIKSDATLDELVKITDYVKANR